MFRRGNVVLSRHSQGSTRPVLSSEATSDTGREGVVTSMVEVARRAKCTRVVESLLDIDPSYQKITQAVDSMSKM